MTTHRFQAALEAIDRELERLDAEIEERVAELEQRTNKRRSLSSERSQIERLGDVDEERGADTEEESTDTEDVERERTLHPHVGNSRRIPLTEAVKSVLDAMGDATAKDIVHAIAHHRVQTSNAGIEQVRTALERIAQRGWCRKRKVGRSVRWESLPPGRSRTERHP